MAHGLGPEALDPDAVERDVAAASGEGYTCDGVTSDGERIEVRIQIDDRLDGSYTWGGSVPEPVTPASPAPSPGG